MAHIDPELGPAAPGHQQQHQHFIVWTELVLRDSALILLSVDWGGHAWLAERMQ